MRIAGKVIVADPHNHRHVVEDAADPTNVLTVDTYLLKGKIIEQGKVYEFLGEIEQKVTEDGGASSPPKENNQEDFGVYMKARVLKKAEGYHKFVYAETTASVNNLIEAMLARMRAKAEAQR